MKVATHFDGGACRTVLRSGPLLWANRLTDEIEMVPGFRLVFFTRGALPAMESMVFGSAVL